MTEPVLIIVLLLQGLASTYLMGVIWFVQVVHYPLLTSVGRAEFPAYEQRHQQLVSYVVAPPMLIEVLTAGLLVWCQPATLPVWSTWVGVGLVAMLWWSTFFVQVPRHQELAKEFQEHTQRRLVATNWLRTAGWSARSLLSGWMFWCVVG